MTDSIETRVEVLLRSLEIAGWVTLILFVPFNYSFAIYDFSFDDLIVPVAIALVFRFERMGLWIVAIAGLPYLMPFRFDAYGAWTSDYFLALLAGWATLHRVTIWDRLPRCLTWRLGILLAVAPVIASLYLGFLTFRLNFEFLAYALVVALAAGGVAAGPVLGVFSVLCFIGFGLRTWGWTGSLDEIIGRDSVLLESLYLGYDLDSPRDAITAAILFYVTRYLLSFDRNSVRSLVGRRVPPSWVGLALVALLTIYAYEWEVSLAITQLTDWDIAVFGSRYVLWLTAILAGFLFGGWGAVYMTALILFCQFFPEYYRGPSFEIEALLVPPAFYWIGALWRRQTRKDNPPKLTLRVFILGVSAALVIFNFLAPLEEHAFVLTVVLWLASALVLYILVAPHSGLSRFRRVIAGPMLDILTFGLVAGICFAFWQQLLAAATSIRGFYTALLSADAFSYYGPDFVHGVIFSVGVITSVLVGAMALIGRLVVAGLTLWTDVFVLLRGRRLSVDPIHASQNTLLLLLDHWAGAPAVPKIMRTLGSTSLLTILACCIAFSQMVGEMEWSAMGFGIGMEEPTEEPLIIEEPFEIEEPPLVGDDPIITIEPSDDQF